MDICGVRERHEALFESLGVTETDSLAPSRIANQFYCEKKVDLTLEHGDIETAAKARGSQTHERAAEGAVEVAEEEFWAALERDERKVMVESPFIGETSEFLLVGVPVAVVFEDGRPELLLERKTTSRPDYLYKNQRIQAWIYGFILDSVGFDTDGLRIAVLSHERALGPDLGRELQELVLGNSHGWQQGPHELLEDPNAVLHVSAYSREEFRSDLEWALGYWREEREPIPTKKPGKCRACEYAQLCPDSKA